MTRKNLTSLAIVVVIGLVIQAGLVAVALDGKKTPAETAVSFARAYYRLDPSMAQWMCGTSSVTCGKCACGNESTDCPKANCSKKPADCPKAVSGNGSENCPKAASGDESTKCPKVDCDNKTLNCANANCGHESTGCSKIGCPKEKARRVNSAVENYLYEARQDAAERGFGENFAKYALYHVETRTEYVDDASALVHLTAHRRLEINPVYAYVARLFRIGDTYEVDASIRVMLENGEWRVCKSSLSSLEES